MSTTKNIVTDGELGKLARRQRDLFTRVEKGVLPIQQVLDALQNVIEGKDPVVPTINRELLERIIDLDADPYIQGGSSVVEHRKGGQFKWDPTLLVFYLPNKQQSGKVICGNNLQKLLARKPVLNANLLDWLIKPKNQHLIPESWKKDETGNIRYIFFWGTIYLDSDGRLYVRCLYWLDGRWSCGDYWLRSSWDCGNPALLFAK